MASLRTWRTAAAAALLVVLATTATAAAAEATTPAPQQARYCKQVDAYRLKTCATAILPDSPLGRQLRWVLTQLAGEAATLTEAEVRAHVSAEFLTIVMPAPEVVQALRQTIAERGTFTFVGFAYPPRAHQAEALIQSTTGERGAIEIGVTNHPPALIEFLALSEAPPTIVPTGRFSGWFDIGGRQLFLRCTGHRSPTVVFEGGLTTDWYELQNQLSGFTRVCSYDRPGGPASRSDPAPIPRTARDFVADLHALLRTAHVPGPYVLAGHSNSGLFTQPLCQHPPPPGGRAGPHRRRPPRLPQAAAGAAQAPAASRGVGGPTPGGDDPAAPAGGPPRGRHLDQRTPDPGGAATLPAAADAAGGAHTRPGRPVAAGLAG